MYGHSDAIAQSLAAWVQHAWDEIHTDHPTTTEEHAR